jgi:hypothetical protein
MICHSNQVLFRYSPLAGGLLNADCILCAPATELYGGAERVASNAKIGRLHSSDVSLFVEVW